jgi:glycosyltransferase involved in cell wall biosynthesis
MTPDVQDQARMGVTSVVVCTRNRGAQVAQTVASILQNRGAAFELIVIDQSTDDETATAVGPFCADRRLRYIRSATVGAGRSRNIGLRAAQGEVVLYTDDDCRAPANWVKSMAAIFDKDASIGMAFCNVQPAAHDEQAGFIPTYVINKDFVARTIADKRYARGIGAGMAVRRTTALSIGAFDEALGPGAMFPANEEGDLAARMLLNGWRVYETNSVSVIHDGFRTWEQGKALAKRNWIGVGAAYAKPIKSGQWRFLPVVLYEGFVPTFWRAFAQLFKLKKPQGVRGFLFFWYGFILGLKTPIDSRRLVFTPKRVSLSSSQG